MGQIYKITHKETDRCYIGQTKRTLEWRLSNTWCGHFIKAFEQHSNNYFHSALRKYGKDAFTYEVIEECDNSKLNEQEIYWIAYYKSNQKAFGYNQTKGGNAINTNFKCNSDRMKQYNKDYWSKTENVEYHKKFMSQQMAQRWQDKEYRQKVISKMRGRKCSNETLKRMSKAQKGKTMSEDAKYKLSIASMHNANVKGRKYMHKDGIVKMIKLDDLQSYLDDGWCFGRGKMKPMSMQGRQNISNAIRRYYENKKQKDCT